MNEWIFLIRKLITNWHPKLPSSSLAPFTLIDLHKNESKDIDNRKSALLCMSSMEIIINEIYSSQKLRQKRLTYKHVRQVLRTMSK